MTGPQGDRFVVSRTDGPHWILAGVLLCVAGGFLWMALAATPQGPRVPGWVFGGSFGLLGLNVVFRSLKKPVRNELVIEPAGISRVIGGVAWALRWDELRAASVVKGTQKGDRHQVVLSPADDRFESRSRSLVRIGDGGFLVAGFELYETEVPRVRELLAKHVGVTAERVPGTRAPAPPPPPVRPAVPEWVPPPVEPSGSVTIHVNGWNRVLLRWVRLFALMIEVGLGAVIEFGPRNGVRTACLVVFIAVFAGMSWVAVLEQQSRSRKSRVLLELSAAGLRWTTYYRKLTVSWPEIAELRMPSGLLEFRPVAVDFPLDRPDLDHLRLGDGWYRMPRALSETAVKQFETHIRSVLPPGVPLALGRG
ncbi:hypothetical protein [Amycolatopsis sp. DG1A-15b]|uniref:hypothetical protein n=1 Tax=Amycolatopsis sp. DG1A-15b TaxID=3052846 RepID=UPI00255B6AA8|nr:hypothetical protein [Amycolatopsis sp. DG1A-15b]WIX86789.1 hypothetical protein QRY02_37315 [Amycolatopsis sp. DG1A-15b]